MSIAEPIALVLAFVYVSIVLAIGDGLRRLLGLSVEFTRKFVHVAVGMIAFPLVWLFREWPWAILPPLAFVLINYWSYRRQIFQGIETNDKNQLGAVYFPVSFSILIPLLWSQPALLVASLMPMTWGDAFAAIVGRRWGAHTFSIFGQTRSLEGSLAMFALSFIATTLTLAVFGQPIPSSLALGMLTAGVATLVEACSPWGIDNLTVPLVSASVLVIASRLAGK